MPLDGMSRGPGATDEDSDRGGHSAAGDLDPEGTKEWSWSQVEAGSVGESQWYQDAALDDDEESCQPRAHKCQRMSFRDPAPVHPAVAQALLEEGQISNSHGSQALGRLSSVDIRRTWAFKCASPWWGDLTCSLSWLLLLTQGMGHPGF